jgi:hypothetical protein
LLFDNNQRLNQTATQTGQRLDLGEYVMYPGWLFLAYACFGKKDDHPAYASQLNERLRLDLDADMRP